MERRENKGIVCVIVIYNDYLTNTPAYSSLIRQHPEDVDCLLVFDNSSEKHIEDIKLQHGEYHYYWNGENLGLSANYNKAAAYAAEHGYACLLLSDQDTSFPEHALKTYKEAVRNYPQEVLMVPKHKMSNGRYLSPSKVFRGLFSEVASGTYDLMRYEIINSGMLIRTDAFWKVGGYKEEVMLDFSDFQFLERLRKSYTSFRVLEMECLQQFSNEEKDKDKLLSRFRIYCRCAAHYEANHLLGEIKLCYLVAKHTFMLCVRCRSFRPVAIAMKELF